jgi:hypothetical protein
VSRFGFVDRVREQWLAATGLALALLALVLGLSPAGGSESPTAVLALRHAVAAGAIVRPSDVVSVPIAAADRTPSMVSRLDTLAGRRSLIGFAGGDFVVQGALSSQDAPSLLRRGERAVALELAPGSAPDSRLLRRGQFVDVVVGSHIAARGLQLLSAASERSGGISVTVRAPAAVALALATGRRGGELRLLLRSAGA